MPGKVDALDQIGNYKGLLSLCWKQGFQCCLRCLFDILKGIQCYLCLLFDICKECILVCDIFINEGLGFDGYLYVMLM